MLKKKNSCQVIVLIANQERSNDMKGKTSNKLRVKRNFFFSGIKQETEQIIEIQDEKRARSNSA